MKVSHEAPLCVMNVVRNYTDYDYALVHLLESNEQYRDFFRESKRLGREIYLDNSLHELGTAIGGSVLQKWIDILEPTNVFVPDVWEDRDKTIINARQWSNVTYPEDTTAVAVIQFKTAIQALTCAQTLMDLGYQKLALSYGLPYYKERANWEVTTNTFADYSSSLSVEEYIGLERLEIVKLLLNNNIINDNSKIHLLGCTLPQEFQYFKEAKCIESIDTSNPVMAAIEGIRYTDEGLKTKPKSNINSHFFMDKKDIDMELLKYNLDMFRKINKLT